MRRPGLKPGRYRVGQIGVEVGDGFYAAEIIFEGDVFVGGVGIFIGQAETDQDAGHFEGVVHLRDERNRATFADEDGALAEALFQSALRAF